MTILDKVIDDVAEAALKSQAKNLVNGWVAAGYIEAAKAPELEAGIVDMVQVAFAMVDKGQSAGAAPAAK